jgi:hypothetical protein
MQAAVPGSGILFPHLQELGYLQVGPGSRLLDDDAENVLSEIGLERAELLQPCESDENFFEAPIQGEKIFVDGQPLHGFRESVPFTWKTGF